MNYKEQTKRISSKLKLAKKADKNLEVFGAETHKYKINKPVKEKQILQFEKEYNITLPDCYRAFLMEVGNGGVSYLGSAAGPYYGIYPLGKHIDELVTDPKAYLCQPAKIYPNMTEELWTNLAKRIEEDEEISDEEYDREMGKIYSGILPLGSQGCTYLHAIILNGEFSGKVVNLDLDGHKPHFTYENNFLGWYERWLDEVIAGYDTGWFGFKMGGNEQELLNAYRSSLDKNTKLEALNGLSRIPTLSTEGIEFLVKECQDNEDTEVYLAALSMLTKYSYSDSKIFLEKEIRSKNEKSMLSAVQNIHWYAKENSPEWVQLLVDILPIVNGSSLFSFIGYIFENANFEYGDTIAPFCDHPNDKIVKQAIYLLGKLKNKGKYLSVLLDKLQSDNPEIIHTTIQASFGLTNKEFIPHFERILNRYEKDEHYLHINIGHCLGKMNLKAIRAHGKNGKYKIVPD